MHPRHLVHLRRCPWKHQGDDFVGIHAFGIDSSIDEMYLAVENKHPNKWDNEDSQMPFLNGKKSGPVMWPEDEAWPATMAPSFRKALVATEFPEVRGIVMRPGMPSSKMLPVDFSAFIDHRTYEIEEGNSLRRAVSSIYERSAH